MNMTRSTYMCSVEWGAGENGDYTLYLLLIDLLIYLLCGTFLQFLCDQMIGSLLPPYQGFRQHKLHELID